ncbi:MAG: DUF4388 domain-containing protein, partial [Candidatus Sericytochromatia bacterium]|nr:DUF4388 domain-containing protein [Candidatus Sericytochromatia bacterium]
SITDPVSMQMGLLYLKGGDVIHAECGSMQGEQAFYTIMAMKSGMFSDMPWIDPTQRTINYPFNHLLMEAARIQDESQATMQDLEATVEAVKKIMEKNNAKDQQEGKSGKSEAVKQVLTQFKQEVPDLICAMVINGRDGRFFEGISFNEKYNLNESSIIFKNLFTTSGDAEVMLTSFAERRRQIDELLITNLDDYSMLKKIKDGKYILYLAFAKSCNLGLVKLTLNNYLPDLEQQLT